jgi:GNAT superfamily N-acetyltransferase
MDVVVRPLEERDVADADRIFRMAFGTFLGLPDPMQFTGDAAMVPTRYRSDPEAAFGAYRDGELVGSNFVRTWGSFGTFGPLSVRPDLWDSGVARALLRESLPLFERRGVRQSGLFTFPNSPKHLGLYQKFGYWPRHLTALMALPVDGAAPTPWWSTYSSIAPEEREAVLAECREVTGSVFEGLDVSREIRAVSEQNIGDVALLREGARLDGFAVCHIGAGSEGGSGTAYVKFGAARPGEGAAARFGRLLEACAGLAAERGASTLMAGVNTARHEAYRTMLNRGFRTVVLGVAMQNPNAPGYNTPDSFVMDDWR